MSGEAVSSPGAPGRHVAGGSSWHLVLAAAAVLLAAADTYVVVVALPSIMSGVGLGVDHLERATPIVSGFLLGYVAVLPLLGRLSDLAGPQPVFLGCLVAFGSGSLLTATAHALSVVVAGRTLQGLGGGGLVPATLTLVASQWPVERRGLPLGVVGAVQELGSVIGPLYGAVVVAASTWRTIFWINLPLVIALGTGFLAGRRAVPLPGDCEPEPRPAGKADVVGALLASLGGVLLVLGLWAPPALAGSVAWGSYWTPALSGAAWVGLTTPVAMAGVALLLSFAAWEVLAPAGVRPLADLRRLPALLAGADVPGAVALAGALACVVVTFSTADPSRQLVASSTPVVAPLGAALLVAFAWRQRRARRPLVEAAALAARPAWGALLVNLALGAGLVAALVDVPLFARATRYPGSQVGAAFILLRFLVAVPAGALAGGLACRRRSRGPAVAAAGGLCAAVAFAAMSSWSPHALSSTLRVWGASTGFGLADVELAACGLGFGLAIAPVTAAVLGAVPARLHGLASALAVVARTVGMLSGLSVLTAIGVRRFYEAQARIGSPLLICPSHPQACPAYDRATTAAVLRELHTVFAGAGACAAVAAALALALLRPVGPAAGAGPLRPDG